MTFKFSNRWSCIISPFTENLLLSASSLDVNFFNSKLLPLSLVTSAQCQRFPAQTHLCLFPC